MRTHLTKRGATYYFRRVVPVELRAALGGRSEFMISLRTKDRGEAERRVSTHTIATDELLQQARAQLREISSVESAARDLDEPAVLSPSEQERADFEALEATAARERWAVRKDERMELRQKLATFRSVELSMTEQAMRDLLRERDEALAQVKEQLAAKERARLSEALPPAIGEPAMGAILLDTDIVDGWAAERKPVQKGLDTYRRVAQRFYKLVGKKSVNQITRRDVLDFKDRLIAEGQSAANTLMLLQRLRTLLQWAADNDHIDGNPAAGVRVVDTEKGQNRRREFDLGSLNRIFASPVFAEGLRPRGGKGEAAYWLPLLALFTGARLEELGQLRPADVQQLTYPDVNGCEVKSWFIRIREDEADDLTLKNAGSERDVPVHPELERLGFLDFVEAARKAKHERIFHLLTPNIYGRLTAKWGEWFGPYLRDTVGVADRRLVFHSFRHTFKQYARYAGIVEGVQRQIMGHSSGDVADQYGSGYPLHQVVAGMASYRVPGLKMPPRTDEIASNA